MGGTNQAGRHNQLLDAGTLAPQCMLGSRCEEVCFGALLGKLFPPYTASLDVMPYTKEPFIWREICALAWLEQGV